MIGSSPDSLSSEHIVLSASSELPIPAPLPKKGELTAHRGALPALTGIRFFAAMYVVFYHSHLPETLDQHHLHFGAMMIRNGLLAVPLFFILSGFILSYTYEGQVARPRGYRRFWEARFARIWPLYMVSLILSTIFNHTTPHSPLVALATVGMVQAWNPFDMKVAGSWNFVCWTLSTEAFFYLLFPPFQQWLERRRPWVLLSCLSLMIAIAVAGAIGSINYEDTRGLHGIPLALVHVPEFIIGVCAGNFFLRYRTRSPEKSAFPLRGALTYLACAASLCLLCQPTVGLARWTALSFAMLLYGLAAERTMLQQLLSTRTLLIGGQISFGIYLLQWPCKAAMNQLDDLLHWNSMPLRFVLDCIVLILLSTAGFYLVEEPARRLIRSLFARTQGEPGRSRA
ncbi:acyltransferase family protein [Silvibacterium dinghuense]|uniref:Acyltransferase n=1 Tax=Silvibacterium dinghuense TaxID=1560006 RepID=A0A4Q1SDH4_9BACT|nr:acyltransferase [Silvibacterium dinghuense]RXS94948.1 acyltransferase [Silvibacterium dinghuense]